MMNHSCVCNTKTIIDSADGGHLLTTLATRDIKRGEQITNQVPKYRHLIVMVVMSNGQPRSTQGLDIIPIIQHIVIRDMRYPCNNGHPMSSTFTFDPVCLSNNNDDNN